MCDVKVPMELLIAFASRAIPSSILSSGHGPKLSLIVLVGIVRDLSGG